MMMFSDLSFLLLFFPVTLVYYFVPKSFRNTTLLLLTALFVVFSNPSHLLFLVSTVLFDFYIGKYLGKQKEASQKKRLFWMAIFLKTIFLLLFQNADPLSLFFLQKPYLETAMGSVLRTVPIGMAFYTLQGIAYLEGVYHEKYRAENSIREYAVFLLMYPKLIAGPLLSYEKMKAVLLEREVSFSHLSDGIVFFLRGLAKKVILAGQIAKLWVTISAIPPVKLSIGMAWLGALAFLFYIYFELASYLDMTRGLALMVGFQFKGQYRYPFLSTSVTGFWSRWYHSLTDWFRRYLYEPIAGENHGKRQSALGILVAWAGFALWHGGKIKFLLWGLYFALILILEKFLYGKQLKKLPAFLRVGYTIFFVLIGFVIVSTPSVTEAGAYLKAMFGFYRAGYFGIPFRYYVKEYAVTLLLCTAFSTHFMEIFLSGRKNNTLLYRVLYVLCHLFLLGLIVIYLIRGETSTFFYAFS